MKFKKIVYSLVFVSFLGISFISFSHSEKSHENEIIEDGPMFYPAATYTNDYKNEPYYSTQDEYGYSVMHLGDLGNEYRGDSVKVAILDSGINYEHEEFKRNGSSILNSNSATVTSSCSRFSTNPSGINDTFGHGTNVASVIAAQINSLGVAGLAPNVDLYIYKVTATNTSGGTSYYFDYINRALNDCITQGIDIINMSFQSYEHAVSYGSSSMGEAAGCSTVLTSKINACYNAGIALIAAAGNYNTSEKSYPASNEHVISVGSLAKGSDHEKAGYSNTSDIDLVAPGSVYTATIGGTSEYKPTNGTSFSSPIVTAACALYKQKYPHCTVEEMYDALLSSCDEISEDTTGWSGFGRLNISRFLDEERKHVTSIKAENMTTEYIKGSTFKFDGSLTATYSDGSSATVNPTSVTKPDMNVLGTKTITLTYVEDGKTVTTTYDITVKLDTKVYVWKRINSVSDLVVGDQYIFANTANNAVNGALGGAYLTKVDATFDTTNYEMEALPDAAMPFTLGGSSDAYTFSYGDGTLLKYSEQSFNTTGNSTYKIAFSGNNAEITAGSYKIYYNASSPRFKIYSSAQASMELYHKEEVVADKELTSITVASPKTSFYVGDTFTFGGTVTAHYSDSSSKTVTGSTFTGYSMNVSGTQTVTVTYVDAYGTASTTYSITINPVVLSSIAVTKAPTKVSYKEGESFSPTGMVVTATYNNGNKSEVSNYTYPTTPLTEGTTSVTISYTENGVTKTATQAITVSSASSGTITFDKSKIASNFKDTYNWYDWTSDEISGKLYAYSNSGKPQFNSSKIANCFYNTTAIAGHITSVEIKMDSSSTARNWSLYLSDEAYTTSSPSYGTQIGSTQSVGTSGYTWNVDSGNYQYLMLSISGGATIIDYIKINYSTAPVTTLVNSLELNTYSKSLEIDDSFTLTAEVKPNNATDKTLTCTSKDSSIATVTKVDNLNYTVKAVGTAGQKTTITVSTTDGSNLSKTCEVTIKDVVTLSSIAISGVANSVKYKDPFSTTNLKVTATYSDGTEADVTNDVTITGRDIDTSVLGKHTITASYQGKTTTFDVKVTNVGASSNVGVSSLIPSETKVASHTFSSKDDTSGTTSVSGITYTATAATGFEARGIAYNNKAATITISGIGSNYKITEVSAIISANAKSSVSCQIGGTAFGSTDNIASGDKNVEHKWSSSSGVNGGTITINTAKASSKTVWILSFSVTYKTEGSTVTYKASPSDQAKAWATYFNTFADKYCDVNGVNTNVAGLRSSWTDLQTEYEAMINLAKDAFFSNADANIVRARRVYSIIISRYSLTNFVKNSTGVSLASVNNPLSIFINKDNSELIIVISIISVISVSSLLIFLKKKKKY